MLQTSLQKHPITKLGHLKMGRSLVFAIKKVDDFLQYIKAGNTYL